MMNKQELNKVKSIKLHELIGRIQGKVKAKVYNKNSKYAGSYYYKLETEIENKVVNKIYVFKDILVTEKLWKAIENADYVDKRYLFYCSQFRGSWQLVNWKELGQSPSKEGYAK